MDKPIEVNSLSELPQYNNHSIDLTPRIDFSKFTFYGGKEDVLDMYLRIARGIGYMFDSMDLVEVESWVYQVQRHGKVIHRQVYALGRDPTNGQLYSVYLM